MRKILILSILFVLVGCKQQMEEVCYESFCINSVTYGIEGNLNVTETNRGTVSFQASITDDMQELRNISIKVYTSDWEFIGAAFEGKVNTLNSSDEIQFRALDPSTEYIAVIHGDIIIDSKNHNVRIAYTEFATDAFVPIDVSGLIDNVRVGDTFAIYDIELLSSDYYVVYYGVFLYLGEEKIGEYTNWGSRNQITNIANDLVFSNLTSNTTYTLVFDVIYESGFTQDNSHVSEVSFTTD